MYSPNEIVIKPTKTVEINTEITVEMSDQQHACLTTMPRVWTKNPQG